MDQTAKPPCSVPAALFFIAADGPVLPFSFNLGPDRDHAHSGGVRNRRMAVESIGSKFETPALKQILELNEALQNSPLVNGLERYHLQFDEINRAMERVRAPWMDIHDRLRSVTAFSELQGIGHAVNHLRSFDIGLVEALRVDLGDWHW